VILEVVKRLLFCAEKKVLRKEYLYQLWKSRKETIIPLT